MSKIYDRYLELKCKEENKLYLFKSGKFYIFIDRDADTINDYLVLKKTKFTKETYKCGFPTDRIEDYIRIFDKHNLKVEIIENVEPVNNEDQQYNEKYIKIKQLLNGVDLNLITPIESINYLEKIMRCINE